MLALSLSLRQWKVFQKDFFAPYLWEEVGQIVALNATGAQDLLEGLRVLPAAPLHHGTCGVPGECWPILVAAAGTCGYRQQKGRSRTFVGAAAVADGPLDGGRSRRVHLLGAERQVCLQDDIGIASSYFPGFGVLCTATAKMSLIGAHVGKGR